MCTVVKGKGYSNPYRHLVSCYQTEEKLLDLFNVAVAEQGVKGGTVVEYFNANAATNYQKSLFGYIELSEGSS